MTKITFDAPKPRTTIKLSKGSTRSVFYLDHEAACASSYASMWLQKADPQGLVYAQSAVARRALDLYVQHLDALSEDQREAEVKLTGLVCRRFARALVAEDRIDTALQVAHEDLSKLPPSFHDLLSGTSKEARAVAHEAREARLDALLPKRFQRGAVTSIGKG